MFKFYRDVAPYMRRHLAQYIVGAIAVVLTVVFTVLLPRLLGGAIDLLSSGQATFGTLSRYALLLVGAALASALFNLLQRLQMIVASRQIEAELRDDLYGHLSRLDRNFYDRARTGDLMNRLASDLLSVREMLGPGLNMGSRVILMALGALIAMVLLEWRLGLLVAATIPLMVVLVATLRRLVAARYGASQEKLSEIAAKTQENFSGARLVRGYAIEDRELASFDRLNSDYFRLNLGLARVEAPLAAIMGLLMALASLIILLYGGRLVIFGGDLSVGNYIAFTTYLAMLSTPVVAIGRLVTIYQRGATSWGRLEGLLRARPRVKDRVRTAPEGLELSGALRFGGVSLTLGGHTVLKNIDLSVRAGSSLGITGRTGSGKTLLTELLTRQFDPTEGAVLLDGCDLRALPLAFLREQVAVVPQEPFLFSETIAENISFGLPRSRATAGDQSPDRAKVEWAADLADLAKDAGSFSQGLDTLLGERGVTLSGGQRQRTAIARAIAREPLLLVLDDALSAVDTETESRILSGLREVMRGRTTVLTSHRASALRETDQIIVLEEGEIVERGTHDELVALGGRYAELERRQRAGALTDADVPEEDSVEEADAALGGEPPPEDLEEEADRLEQAVAPEAVAAKSPVKAPVRVSAKGSRP